MVVEKLVGAAAERGADLAACADLAQAVDAATRSMGVALGGCRVPTNDTANLELAPGHMEIGIGIHGEPGRRQAPIAPANEIAEELVAALLAELSPGPRTPLLVFVNGLGGTPRMELYSCTMQRCGRSRRGAIRSPLARCAALHFARDAGRIDHADGDGTRSLELWMIPSSLRPAVGA